jgi:hypothetical protein
MDGGLRVVNVVKGLLLVFVAAFNLSACAGQQYPLNATVAASLKGRQIATTARRPTPFFITKPGTNNVYTLGAFGALVVAAAMSDAGARVFRDNAIADPAPYMAQQLGDDVRRRFGLQLEQKAVYVSDDAPEQITAAHPAADVLLDVWIDSVNLEPVPRDASKYRVRYTAYLRLIDARFVHVIDGKKGLVIGHGTCRRNPDDAAHAPTYDEFLANGAQRLKQELDIAALSCVEEFRTKVLTASPN